MNRETKLRYYFKKPSLHIVKYEIDICHLERGDMMLWLDRNLLEFDRDLIARAQYTGSLDKNGQEIYEGDIVTKRNRPDLRCLVYFDDRDFSYRLAVRGDKQFDKTLPLMFADKVIGNVYQHPNLLTESSRRFNAR